LTVSLPICIPFISSSCLIVLARNSKTMLNRSGDSVYPCLICDFRGNGFSFSPLSIMLAIGLPYIAFIMLGYIPSIPSFLRPFIYLFFLYSFIHMCIHCSGRFTPSPPHPLASRQKLSCPFLQFC
jgi:hypothetical protein